MWESAWYTDFDKQKQRKNQREMNNSQGRKVWNSHKKDDDDDDNDDDEDDNDENQDDDSNLCT